MIDSTVGDYRIVKQLGQGGMGAVYEAVQARIGRRVALKVLLPQFAQDNELVQRFFNEARAVNAINHPGIVQVSEINQSAEGSIYMVMELLEGETLSLRLRRHKDRGGLGEAAAVRICWQVAAALAAGHHKGIVHRDVKPGNIMIVADPVGPGGERVKVLDFGIAKLQTSDFKTRTGQMMGTVAFMSPEQIRSAASVDGRSDVYALGTLIFLLVTGRLPFVGARSDLELVTMHLSDEPPTLASLNRSPPVSQELSDLVARMLAKQASDRPQMADVCEKLQAMESPSKPVPANPPTLPLPAIVDGAGAEPLGPHSQTTLRGSTGQTVPRLSLWGRQRTLAAVGLLGVMILGGVLFWALRGSSTPPVVEKPAAPRPPVAKIEAPVEKVTPPIEKPTPPVEKVEAPVEKVEAPVEKTPPKHIVASPVRKADEAKSRRSAPRKNKVENAKTSGPDHTPLVR